MAFLKNMKIVIAVLLCTILGVACTTGDNDADPKESNTDYSVSPILTPSPSPSPSPSPAPPLLESEQATPQFIAGPSGLGDSYFPNLGNGGYDVKRYVIEVEWDPKEKWLRGTTVIEAKSTENLLSFNVDFAANSMQISEVTVNGTRALFTAEENEIVVIPAVGLPSGTNFNARFVHEGSPSLVLLENTSSSIGGWFSSDQGVYVAGEPSSSRGWHPVNDHPQDRAQFRIEMTIPSNLDFVTNGVFLGTTQNGEVSTWIYETAHPRAPYLTTLAIGQFEEVIASSVGGLPIRHWIEEGIDREILENVDYDKIVSVLTDLFGPYPFDTYGVLALNRQLGFALETQTLSLFGSDTLPRQNIHVHELAHQWFGNHLTVESWSEIWLNEGFATYSEALYYEAINPEFDIYNYLVVGFEGQESQWLGEPPPGNPGPELLFGASVYYRGALTLHALRRTIGDEAFFTSLREYVDQFGGTNVSTDDFIQVVEEVSGEVLSDFFDRWLFGPVLPAMPS
jgi:aminopeptidase N